MEKQGDEGAQVAEGLGGVVVFLNLPIAPRINLKLNFPLIINCRLDIIN